MSYQFNDLGHDCITSIDEIYGILKSHAVFMTKLIRTTLYRQFLVDVTVFVDLVTVER